MKAWTMIDHKVTNMIDRNKQWLIFIAIIPKLKSQQICPPADFFRDLIILLQILQRIS